jgi:glycosidase
MRNEMNGMMKYWVYTANCDGFRCDYADGPPADFWKQKIDYLNASEYAGAGDGNMG